MTSRTIKTVTLLMLTLAGATLASTTTFAGVPPDGTDHGVNETTFVKFWSEDEDTNETVGSINTTDDSDGLRQLLQVTDWTFDTPPTDSVNAWNTGDHKDFQHGGTNESVYPSNTERTDAELIKDAYIRTFSISPSTEAYKSGDTPVQFIQSDGTVNAVLDYRIEQPEEDTSGDYQVRYELANQEVTSVTLYVDETPVAQTTGTHTPSLSYSNIDSASTITVETTIATTLEKETREKKTTCTGSGENETCTTEWVTETESITDEVTVSDTQEVTVQNLDVTGETTVQTRDGDTKTGYIIEANSPWSHIQLPDGTIVQSNWRFYTASNRDWGTLKTTNGDSTTERNSSVRPVQIYAFPSEYDLQTNTTDSTVLSTSETVKDTPSLPDNIDVSVANETYTEVNQVVVDVPGNQSGKSVSAHGLMGNDAVTPNLEQKSTHETNLTLLNVEKTPGNVTVSVRVEDAQTGDAVTSGTVTVGQTETALNSTGETTVTVDRQAVSIGVTYNPVPWWKSNTQPVYSGSTTSVSMAPDLPGFDAFANLAVATLFWVAPMALTIYALNMISDGAIYNRGDN